MRRILSAIIGALVCSATAAVAQPLDEAAIVAAMRAGEARKYGHLVSECLAIPGFGSHLAAEGLVRPLGNYTITLTTAPGRIAMMAAEAKRLYRPFAPGDVPEEVRAGQTVYVAALPAQPTNSSDSIHVAPPIERIVLKSKVNAAAVVQPRHLEVTPVQWSNLLGGKVDGTTALATFAAAEVRELPAGEFDMVLITTAGERRCKVGTKDRERLFR
jgi:hypothetical protein